MTKCKICLQENCKKHYFFFNKRIERIDGSTPPEVFVGRYGYPNVYAGLLSPNEHGDTEPYSSHEIWHKQKFPISTILKLRNKLIY